MPVSLFDNLPDLFLLNLVTVWLELSDVSLLDQAYSCHECRQRFLTMIKSMKRTEVLRYTLALGSSDATYIRCGGKRGVDFGILRWMESRSMQQAITLEVDWTSWILILGPSDQYNILSRYSSRNIVFNCVSDLRLRFDLYTLAKFTVDALLHMFPQAKLALVMLNYSTEYISIFDAPKLVLYPRVKSIEIMGVLYNYTNISDPNDTATRSFFRVYGDKVCRIDVGGFGDCIANAVFIDENCPNVTGLALYINNSEDFSTLRQRLSRFISVRHCNFLSPELVDIVEVFQALPLLDSVEFHRSRTITPELVSAVLLAVQQNCSVTTNWFHWRKRVAGVDNEQALYPQFHVGLSNALCKSNDGDALSMFQSFLRDLHRLLPATKRARIAHGFDYETGLPFMEHFLALVQFLHAAPGFQAMEVFELDHVPDEALQAWPAYCVFPSVTSLCLVINHISPAVALNLAIFFRNMTRLDLRIAIFPQNSSPVAENMSQLIAHCPHLKELIIRCSDMESWLKVLPSCITTQVWTQVKLDFSTDDNCASSFVYRVWEEMKALIRARELHTKRIDFFVRSTMRGRTIAHFELGFGHMLLTPSHVS